MTNRLRKAKPLENRSVKRKPVSKKGSGSPRARRTAAEGWAIAVAIVERGGDQVDRVEARATGGITKRESRRKAQSHKGRLQSVAQILAAVGHPQRVSILMLLLEGPAVYRALLDLTGLKAGPLYHHINQLRLAGLILPKQRDLYELTRAGRNIVLCAMVLPKLCADRRRRPVGGVRRPSGTQRPKRRAKK